MRVTVITPPQPIVSMDEARAHLRVDEGEEDLLISSLIDVATAWLDGPDGWLGRALGEQVLEARLDTWPRPLRLPCPPLLSVEAASYVDPNGVVQQIPIVGGLLDLGSWPCVRGREGDIVIRYRAGYVSSNGASTVPAPIRHAILLMVSHLFNNRDAVTVTAAQPAKLPLGVDALLSPFRVWSV